MKLARLSFAGILVAMAGLSSSQKWTNKETLWAKPFIRSVKSKGMLVGYPDGLGGEKGGS